MAKAETLTNLARIAITAGRAAEAIARCRRALALPPHPKRAWRAWNNLATAPQHAGHTTDAREFIERALNAADLYGESGDHQQALDAAGMRAYSRDTRGHIHLRLGTLDDAYADFATPTTSRSSSASGSSKPKRWSVPARFCTLKAASTGRTRPGLRPSPSSRTSQPGRPLKNWAAPWRSVASLPGHDRTSRAGISLQGRCRDDTDEGAVAGPDPGRQPVERTPKAPRCSVVWCAGMPPGPADDGSKPG